MDAYETPSWCVHRLLEAVELPGGLWLEPSAGSGKIITATATKRRDVIWHAVEARDECIPILDAIPTCQVAVHGSFQAVPVDRRYAVVFGNPPYRSALQIIQHALNFAPIVVMLLRLNWLASRSRRDFVARHLAEVYVLPDRPSFFDGTTDATEYAWMRFEWERVSGVPATLRVLKTTPAKERAAAGKSPKERGQRSLFAE